MDNRALLEHLTEAVDRAADNIVFEIDSRSTEWLDKAAIERIRGDSEDIREAVAFVKKRLPVSSEEESI